MLMSIRSAPAAATRSAAEAITSGSWPNSCTDTGCSSGWIRSSSRQRALVAVVHGEARDHLRDGQAGAVALGLQAHEPVADSGQRREHDPVGDLTPPSVQLSVSDRRHGVFMVRITAMDIGDADRPWTRDRRSTRCPGIELFDAHTHLGQNDPDGMRQTPEELLAGLQLARRPGRVRVPDARARRLSAGQRHGDRRPRASRRPAGAVLPRQPARRTRWPRPSGASTRAPGGSSCTRGPSSSRSTTPRSASWSRSPTSGPLPILIHAGPRDPGARAARRRARRGVSERAADPRPRRDLRPVVDLAGRAD